MTHRYRPRRSRLVLPDAVDRSNEACQAVYTPSMPRTRTAARATEHDAALARQIGARIREARRRSGMTQQQLAGDRYTKAYVSALETGIARPSMVALRYLAERLALPPSHFLDEQNPAWSRLEVDMTAGRRANGRPPPTGTPTLLDAPLDDQSRARRSCAAAPRRWLAWTAGGRRSPPRRRQPASSARLGRIVGRGAGPLLAGLRPLPVRPRGRCAQPAHLAPRARARRTEGRARVRDAPADGARRGRVAQRRLRRDR